MTDFFNKKATIYNDIPADGVNARRWDRCIIDKCNIQGGYINRTDGTITNIVNAQSVITKDVEHYKNPKEYAKLPIFERENFFTAQVGDFIVFGEVDDVVSTAQEFSQLQQKYKDNGIRVSSVQDYIYGMSTDNVTFTNA